MIIELLQNLLKEFIVLRYVLFILLLVVVFFVTKFVYYVFSKTFKALASKTKSKLDDLLIEALQKPILVLVFIGGMHFGKDILYLSEQAAKIYTQVLTVVFFISITWFIVKFIDALLANYLQPLTKSSKTKIDDTLYPVLRRLVNFFIYAVAIAFILQYLGFEITGLLAGLGIGGLAFALAAQDILSNFFGGAAIIADKPFKVGDRIRIEGNDGFVTKVGLRTTALETFDGTKIVLPNKTVAHTVLENVSSERARRVKVILGVEYSTTTKKLEKAKKVLEKIVLENPSTEDKSLVHFKSFGPSSLDIQVIYWIKDLDNILQAQDEINFAIKRAFEKEGLEFAYPSQTVYVKK